MVAKKHKQWLPWDWFGKGPGASVDMDLLITSTELQQHFGLAASTQMNISWDQQPHRAEYGD